MQKTDSGWIAHVRLKPGKYLYKYIVDGRWSPDPYNRQKEDDLNGDYNSIVFCYNYAFRLAGYPGAQNVWVAGSFNGWNSIELRLQRINNGWVRGMYLREGTHAYKFIVDRTWILDPANKVVREDGSGNENSFISIGDTMYFRLAGFPNAKKVIVTGNFNGWNESELVMQKIDGGWELPYVLRPGNYEYKFICDGKWMPDPANPYTVGSGDFTNSIITIKPNYLFVLVGKSYARSVTVAGTFNGWNSKSYKMIYKDGRWTFPLYLSPGKHLYKFVVDDKWILDPDNKLWEENEYGTGNSILWIE
jgi:1,4-alpha-glucan branching enzyme